MIVSTNPLIVQCEGCGKRLALKRGVGYMADELQKQGWSWLRGDEAFDHVCSQVCRDKLTPKAVCANMKPVIRAPGERAKLGGPRYVCGRPANHTGPCGDWMRVSQSEHAKLLDARADAK